MILDQFWKIIFLILLCIGFSFWWGHRKSQKTKSFLIDELGELITAKVKTDSPKADKRAWERFYKSIDALRQIEEIMGEKFEINMVIQEAIQSSEASEKFPVNAIADSLEINYDNARSFGLLNDDAAINRLEQGLTPIITEGHWAGEKAVVGYFIVPSINGSIKQHIANFLLLPSSINEMMQFEDFSRRVRNKANDFLRAKILDQGSFDDIDNTHKSRVERSKI
ncbi:MAG: hypothetical protein GY899_19285 [Verrucomicrobiaceae bacterium]|nr:hypothetical protein [Verrucomicrobiaceae bacterium]